MTKEQFKEAYRDKLYSLYARTLEEASDKEKYLTLASLIRDEISRKWLRAKKQRARQQENQEKQVYYFSIEFLLGRMLDIHMINLGMQDTCEQGLRELGIELAQLKEEEEDPGLGNGGLGRLAACYLDSMAALGLNGHGCGIRYRYGLFEQQIIDGAQYEFPDDWLKYGYYPWEYRAADEAVEVRFGGGVRVQANGRTVYIHENYEAVSAVPYDIPITGYHNNTVNTLRLWSAEAELAKQACVAGQADCRNALEYKQSLESISHVLYPDDTYHEGKVLRLKQQYFMVSAGLQSILRDFRRLNLPYAKLPDKVAVHINDTHPALAIPEMMRLLVDEAGLGWEDAWDITVRTMSYTNHTILPEAMEKWPEDLFQTLLPRIYMIVHEINERFCRELWGKNRGNWEKIRHMAVIADGYVHMAHLAIAGSHSINGVAVLHTDILKKEVLHDFWEAYPQRFNNKTNGVTHRRWLLAANPGLAALITETIGEAWLEDPCRLQDLAQYAGDASFQQEIAAIKRRNKQMLARIIRERNGIAVDVDSIFDVQVKRIHAYKRQSLNVLQIMDLYQRLLEDPDLPVWPRTFMIGGKAAMGYYIAKRTIKLINSLAEVINNDKRIRDKIKLVFLANYNVSLAEVIIPATDVSEQIPTASREACGTANMKFMMNGSVTLGTLDGGNIEIRDAAGRDNIVTFGLTAPEVLQYYRQGGYNPWDIYHSDPRVKRVLEKLVDGSLSPDREDFRAHYDSFLHHGDQYFVLKDFAAYVAAQEIINDKYQDQKVWRQMCIHNIAHAGWFSSDRTFSEYAAEIWRLDQTKTSCQDVCEQPNFSPTAEQLGIMLQ